MKWILAFFRSSIGKKTIMSTTGLYLSIFLVMHLAGNLLLLLTDNGEAFRAYSEFMHASLFIFINEIILFASLLIHIPTAIMISLQNRKARKSRYQKTSPGNSSTMASRFMVFTGLLTLGFLVLHLNSFFVPVKILQQDMDLYSAVIEKFSQPVYVGVYLFCMVILALHLRHGFTSAFQTFGLNHSRYNTIFKLLGGLISIVVPIAFAAIPAVVYVREVLQ